MTWKTCQIITNGGWTNTIGCVHLCCGSASLSCVLGLFLYYVSQRRGGLGLLILGGEPIADEVCLKILFLCVSSSWWSVCKSLMLSCPSRPLMNDLSEIYFYNPTPSAFLNLHTLVFIPFTDLQIICLCWKLCRLANYISTSQEINSTIRLLFGSKNVKNVKVFNDQQLSWAASFWN